MILDDFSMPYIKQSLGYKTIISACTVSSHDYFCISEKYWTVVPDPTRFGRPLRGTGSGGQAGSGAQRIAERREWGNGMIIQSYFFDHIDHSSIL